MEMNFAMCTVCHELKCHIRAQCEGGEGFRNLRKHTYVILEHSLKYVNNNHWQKCFVFGSECVWQRGGSHCMLAGRLFIPFFSTLYDLVMHCDMVYASCLLGCIDMLIFVPEKIYISDKMSEEFRQNSL